MKLVTFLRGINMLGHNKISMADLSEIHENLGFKNIKTVLNSGNVIFEIEEKVTKKLLKRIKGDIFEKVSLHMEKPIDIQIVEFSAIKKLLKKDPFLNTPENHIKYISFIYASTLSIENKTNSVEILPSILATVIPDNSIKMMTILDKEYGKKITTRN